MGDTHIQHFSLPSGISNFTRDPVLVSAKSGNRTTTLLKSWCPHYFIGKNILTPSGNATVSGFLPLASFFLPIFKNLFKKSNVL